MDDERPVLTVIETNLKIEGYDVLTAENGVEALQMIREHHPDCVLLDINMPEMDGWEVLDRMRADPELAGTPVVMLTALADDASISRGWEYDIQFYLTKPFEPDELLEVVKRVLEIKAEQDRLEEMGAGSEQ